MYHLVLCLHVVIAIILVALILIQHGKGADIGASFGSGASNTVFGSQGSGGFLFRMTGSLVLLFFVTSLVMSWIATANLSQSVDMTQQNSVTRDSGTVPVPEESHKK